MTKEEKKQRIEGFRKIIKPFIAKELQKINYEGMGVIDKTEFKSDFEAILTLAESALEQEPCEDAISREEAFMCLTGENLPEDRDKYIALVNDRIKALPPVTPIRPKGEWKYDKTIQNWRCSKCYETPKTLGFIGTKEFMTEHFKFCNHCGADMRGEENDKNSM